VRGASLLEQPPNDDPTPADLVVSRSEPEPTHEPAQEVLNEGAPIPTPPVTTAQKVESLMSEVRNMGLQYGAQDRLLNGVMASLDEIRADLALKPVDWGAVARGDERA
jgi:hypothetical protein